MVTYDYTGVVEVIGETKAFGTNGFTKRELVVGNDVDSQNKYPNPVLFTFKVAPAISLAVVKNTLTLPFFLRTKLVILHQFSRLGGCLLLISDTI